MLAVAYGGAAVSVGFPLARPIGTPQSGPVERLTVSGFYFVRPDGTLHRRKSITAFTLSKRAAQGRHDDARRFMDWAVSIGANEFRVFSQCDWTGPPHSGVETGWAYDADACAWVCEEAADRGCYVELVAHTYDYALDAMVAHLQAMDALCLVYDNALLEVANEPPVNNIPLADILARYTPHTPGWASGHYGPTPPYPAGQSITTHTDRKPEWPRCFKDANEFADGRGPYVPFSPPFTGPIMLDEPPQVEQTIRDAVPGWSPEDDWRAYGSGGALFAAGVTLHGHPSFQKCDVPSDPAVVACSRAVFEGMDAVPVQAYSGYEHPDDRGSLRRYNRWGANGKKYQISVRPYEFGVV